jgi:cell division protein FtsL
MTSEIMVLGYALLEKITEMEEKIKEQDKEINDLLKAIKEYERGES